MKVVLSCGVRVARACASQLCKGSETVSSRGLNAATRLSIICFPLKKKLAKKKGVCCWYVGMIEEVNLGVATYKSNTLLLNRRCMNLDLKECDTLEKLKIYMDMSILIYSM